VLAPFSNLISENLRSGFVWRVFMRNPDAQPAVRLACKARWIIYLDDTFELKGRSKGQQIDVRERMSLFCHEATAEGGLRVRSFT
jgi:hypothetical protein